MHPIDVPTRETVDFIQAHVRPDARILEVGCGDGEVALALSQIGFPVTAIDSDAERIAKAQQIGVHAVVASWPDFEIAPVDAIVFTRSLHHMDRLTEAIERARAVLKPNGLLLVDDFAVESATEQTLTWFRELIQSQPFVSGAEPHPDSFVAKMLSTDTPLKTFRDHHTAHEVHPFDLMHRLIQEDFSARVQRIPYFYRYFASVAADNEESENLVRDFLDRETEAAEQGQIALIGRRIIAHRQ